MPSPDRLISLPRLQAIHTPLIGSMHFGHTLFPQSTQLDRCSALPQMSHRPCDSIVKLLDRKRDKSGLVFPARTPVPKIRVSSVFTGLTDALVRVIAVLAYLLFTQDADSKACILSADRADALFHDYISRRAQINHLPEENYCI